MTSYILENSSFADDIRYECDISALHALAEPLNEFSNVVRKIDWNVWAKLEISGQTYAELTFGETIFEVSDLNLNSDTFINYENLTIDIISSWIDEQNPNIKENLKNQLLDRKIYVTNILPLPWETSQSVETEEPATTEEPPSETP